MELWQVERLDCGIVIKINGKGKNSKDPGIIPGLYCYYRSPLYSVGQKLDHIRLPHSSQLFILCLDIQSFPSVPSF